MYKLKILMVFFSLLIALELHANTKVKSVVLESSTLLEFTQLVSDIVKRPVIVTAKMEQPFSINATFSSDLQLIALLRSSVVSSGYYFDASSRAIVISEHGFLNSPELVTKSYSLKHLPSNYAYQLFKNLFASSSFRSSGTKNNKRLQPAQSKKGNSSFRRLTPVVVDSFNDNSLVIVATKKQHINIAKIISSIDKPRKQVLIEAVISEVSDKDFQGLQANMKIFKGVDSVSSTLSSFNPSLGLSLKLINSKSLRFFLDYLQTSDSSNILSKPKIVTLDRERANIVVGQNVPFVTGSSTSQASSTSTPFQTIVRADVGLKFVVTPIITPSGLIELTIYQESSTVNADTTASDIITNVRSFTSKVLLHDGESILLGGLLSKKTSNGKSGSIPFISDIPFIGWLFSSHSDNHDNLNLLVMISAKQIKDGQPLPATSWVAVVEPAHTDGLDVPVTHHK